MRVGDRLARAKQEANRILANRGGQDQAQVLTVGSSVQAMTQTVNEGNELRAAVEAIQASDARSSYGEFARALRGLEQTSNVPVEAHFISDMQRSSLPPAFADLRLGSETTLQLHKIADGPAPNYAVESVSAPPSVFDPKKVRIQATVAAYGAPAAKRTVTLLVNGKSAGSKTVDVPENGRATAEFVGIEADYGFTRGEVKIDSGDTLTGDDVFYFTMERSDPRPVLFVYEARQQRGLLYYRAALDSAGEGAFLLDAATTDQVGNIGLSKYSFVVLSDVGTLPASFEESLKDYVRKGGGVLVAAGPATAGRRQVPVTGEAVKDTRYASRGGERFLVAGSMDAAHPILRATGRWENVKFYQATQVDTGQGRVLARLSDDTPLLIEKRMGEGRTLLFTSTLDNISNDFPLRPSFVPFVEQTARYLVGSEVRPSSYPVDSYIELRAERGVGTVEVLDPQGKRALDLKQAAAAQSFLLKETGYYDIGRANGRHELVAVNADRKESDLEPAPEETLALWQGSEQQQKAAAAEQAEQERTSPLWWYVLLVGAVLALAESLLANRYLGEAPGEA
jgi:hypothetical protein